MKYCLCLWPELSYEHLYREVKGLIPSLPSTEIQSQDQLPPSSLTWSSWISPWKVTWPTPWRRMLTFKDLTLWIFTEESVGQQPLISITKPEELQVVVLLLVVYLVFDLTWLFCTISDKKPTEQKMKDKENCKKSKKWERVKSYQYPPGWDQE